MTTRDDLIVARRLIQSNWRQRCPLSCVKEACGTDTRFRAAHVALVRALPPGWYCVVVYFDARTTTLQDMLAVFDRAIEAWQSVFGNQIPLEKLPDYHAHALMHHQLSDNQQWQRHQESNLCFHIHKKRHDRASAPCLPLQSREDQ